MSQPSDAERLARVALSRVVTPDDAATLQAVLRQGAVAVWDRLRAAHPGVAPERDLAAAERLGARVITPSDAEWPPALGDLERAVYRGATLPGGQPLLLWVRGPMSLVTAAERSVAIVGARAATGYGQHVAGELAFGLAERGWTVISGAAYGIDAAAHRGALAAGGPTLAVLAGGLDVPYPVGNRQLLERLAEEGLLVSELACGCAPTRVRFLTRNRLIAAMSRGTLVVEAGLRSGARNTLAHARALGRLRLVVPGPITSAMSAGAHLELRADPEARLVTSVEEVFEEVGPIGELAPWPQAPVRARDGLDVTTARILDAVPLRRSAGPASIAAVAGLPLGAVLPVLGRLVAGGWVEQGPRGFRVAREPP
ncbi:MAG: DNA-processing protein DprA [Mycobacteriales bacterium]